MKRTWPIWAIFGAALLLAFAAMAWVTATALRLDRAQAEAARQAFVEENVRLALWRLDSTAAPLVVRESARVAAEYTGSPMELMAAMSSSVDDKWVFRQVSPLAVVHIPADVRLHFQFNTDGAVWSVWSPQVPGGRYEGLEDNVVLYPDRRVAAKRLEELRGWLDVKTVEAGLGAEQPMSAVQLEAPTQQVKEPQAQDAQQPAQQAKGPQVQDLKQRAQQFQSTRNAKEYLARAQSNMSLNTVTQQEAPSISVVGKTATGGPATPVWIAAEQVMRPMWIGEHLLLVRRATTGRIWNQFPRATSIQGCWLDWPGIRARLLESIRDLLPAASLEPVTHLGSEPGERLMAALPVRLVPGPVTWAQQDGLSPVETSLVAAWGCMVLAAVAVIVLLVGVVGLSERRAAFVSAVTHELRTPLTTFRMYSEMLDAGMVEGETRREYISTLRTEAERLGHLVENVLAYARIESGRARGRVEPATLGALVERSRGLLSARAKQADMALVVECDAKADGTLALADASAVEQILFNLVDNACKYAATAEDRRIHLSARATPEGPALFVRDHGPGIPPDEMRRVFRAFHKPSRDAANSAPGVGLGLSLSRRLAREMNGELRLEPQAEAGACFVLTLPPAATS